MSTETLYERALRSTRELRHRNRVLVSMRREAKKRAERQEKPDAPYTRYRVRRSYSLRAQQGV